MIVAIVGTRAYTNQQHVWDMMNIIVQKYPNVIFISGDCDTGPDHYALEYCKQNGIDIIICGAGWIKYGKAGGSIRNKRIAEQMDVGVAFWDKKSPGTRSFIDAAKAVGKLDKVFIYDLLPL